MRRERLGEDGLQAPVGFDDVEVVDAGREIGAQDPEAAADLEHDIVRGELREAADHAEQVVVDEEVLPELAVRADAEARKAFEACARLAHGRCGRAHHPKSRAALSLTIRSSVS